MSSFRDLLVYKKTRETNKKVFLALKNSRFDRNLSDQLSRASTSIMLNIAEGAGRFSKRDKRHFFIIARASAQECMALFDIAEDLELLPGEDCVRFQEMFVEISKMLFGMIRNLDSKIE